MEKKLLLLSALFSLIIPLCAIEEDNLVAEMRTACFDNDCDDLCNSLALKDLCAKKIKAKQGLFKELCARQIKAESICTQNLGVENVAIANVCASDINAKNICVAETARLNKICNPYGASVEFLADTPYTLGDPINFNSIIDDPNGNVSLAPFSYTVPVYGYYTAAIQLDVNNLAGANAILGTPVSNIVLKVNGVPRRQAFIPFLTFNNSQQADLSFLFLLNAGDVLTVEYVVLVVGNTGTIPYVGTTNIVGGPDRTIFKIHYLATPCGPAAGCESCSFVPLPCSTECTPLPNSCIHKP